MRYNNLNKKKNELDITEFSPRRLVVYAIFKLTFLEQTLLIIGNSKILIFLGSEYKPFFFSEKCMPTTEITKQHLKKYLSKSKTNKQMIL